MNEFLAAFAMSLFVKGPASIVSFPTITPYLGEVFLLVGKKFADVLVVPLRRFPSRFGLYTVLCSPSSLVSCDYQWLLLFAFKRTTKSLIAAMGSSSNLTDAESM